MTWTTWKPALALGAVLAAGGAASADDRDTHQLPGSTGTTMTLGGKGTAQQAATEDTELARGYRGGYSYHGYHGGYGYRGGYGGYGGYGYRGGYGGYYGSYYRGNYGGYYGGYRPAYYYTPRVYYSNYYYPTYYPSYYGGGIYIGISGGNSTDVPVVNLGGIGARPMSQPATLGDGTFQYDGGPANPVPQPKADPQMNPSAAPADLPVSFKPKPATSPYKYKAYGEK